MAQYPSAPAVFTVKQTGDSIEAQHINDLQEEVIVLTDNLLNGLAHHVIPAATNLYDLGNATKKWRNLRLAGLADIAGPITAGGPVTAPSFVGNGSGLTGVPVAGVLDDLLDVTAPAPANGEVLTFDLATTKWINKPITLPGGGVANLNDLLDVTLTGPVEGQMLVFRSGQWVNETIVTGGGATIPPGLISPYGGATAPAGYLLCDGAAVSRTTFAALFAVLGVVYGAGDGSTTFNVPDLQRRFPLGKAASGEASTLGELLGLWNHTHGVVAHSHAAGGLAVASHNHAAGTLAVDAHTHPAGGLVVLNHSHDASGLAVASHVHGAGTLVAGDHQHLILINTQNAGDHTHAVTGVTDAAGGHSHLVTGTQATDSGGSFNSVITSNTTTVAPHQHNLTVNAANAGDHFHPIDSATRLAQAGVLGSTAGATAGVTGATGGAAPGVSGATGAATPALSGNTGSVSPAVTGVTATDGASTTSPANPPSLTLNYIVKT